MNKKQQWTMIIGVIVIAAMSIFTPYNGVCRKIGANPPPRFIGYHCIFSPPIPTTVYEKIANRKCPESFRAELVYFNAEVDVVRWIIQTTTCIIVIVGVILYQIKLPKRADEKLKEINTDKQEKQASQPPPRQTITNKLRHLKKYWGWYLFGLFYMFICFIILYGLFSGYDVATAQHFQQGIDKFKLQDFTGAIQAYNKAIELDPNYAEAYYVRGCFKESLKDKQGALKDYSKAGELGYTDAYKQIQRIQKGN